MNRGYRYYTSIILRIIISMSSLLYFKAPFDWATIQGRLYCEGCICRGRHACTYTASSKSPFVCMTLYNLWPVNGLALLVGLSKQLPIAGSSFSFSLHVFSSHPFTHSFLCLSCASVSLPLLCHSTFKMLGMHIASQLRFYRGFAYAFCISLW